jgi:hypothetical protein
MDFSVGNEYLGPYGDGWIYLWAGGANTDPADYGDAASMQPGVRLYTGPPATAATFGQLTYVGQYLLPGMTGWATVTSVNGSTITLATTGSGTLGDPSTYVSGKTASFDLRTDTIVAQP